MTCNFYWRLREDLPEEVVCELDSNSQEFVVKVRQREAKLNGAAQDGCGEGT